MLKTLLVWIHCRNVTCLRISTKLINSRWSSHHAKFKTAAAPAKPHIPTTYTRNVTRSIFIPSCKLYMNWEHKQVSKVTRPAQKEKERSGQYLERQVADKTQDPLRNANACGWPTGMGATAMHTYILTQLRLETRAFTCSQRSLHKFDIHPNGHWYPCTGGRQDLALAAQIEVFSLAGIEGTWNTLKQWGQLKTQKQTSCCSSEHRATNAWVIAHHCIETWATEKIPAITHVTSLAASGKIKYWIQCWHGRTWHREVFAFFLKQTVRTYWQSSYLSGFNFGIFIAHALFVQLPTSDMVAAVLSGLQSSFLSFLSLLRAHGLSIPGVFLGSSRLGSFFLGLSFLCLFLSRRSLWLCFNRSHSRTGFLSPSSVLWLSVGSALGLLVFSSLAFGRFFFHLLAWVFCRVSLALVEL